MATITELDTETMRPLARFTPSYISKAYKDYLAVYFFTPTRILSRKMYQLYYDNVDQSTLDITMAIDIDDYYFMKYRKLDL
jgi:hypothetical protein